MKYKDYKHLIICISIISLWIMILFFLGNIVSSKINILNIERNQQQEKLISYYDFMAKNKNTNAKQSRNALLHLYLKINTNYRFIIK